MSRKALIVLAVVLVVLGALAYFGQGGRSTAPTAGGPLVPGLEAALNDVAQVTITKAGGETVATIEKHADGWTVAEKGGYAADVAKLRQNLRALAEAKILETKTANPAFYDKLGVQDIASDKATGLAVAISVPGKDFGTLILGDAKGSKQRYARRASEAQSYLIDRDPSFPKTAAQWLDPVILDVRGNRVRQVTIKHPDGEVVTISKPDPDAMNFDVAGVPEGPRAALPGRREPDRQFAAGAQPRGRGARGQRDARKAGPSRVPNLRRPHRARRRRQARRRRMGYVHGQRRLGAGRAEPSRGEIDATACIRRGRRREIRRREIRPERRGRRPGPRSPPRLRRIRPPRRSRSTRA